MNIEDTYNIHKTINCIFRKFKSKWLCKKGLHNFRINPNYKNLEWNWKCYCCGKEVIKSDKDRFR